MSYCICSYLIEVAINDVSTSFEVTACHGTTGGLRFVSGDPILKICQAILGTFLSLGLRWAKSLSHWPEKRSIFFRNFQVSERVLPSPTYSSSRWFPLRTSCEPLPFHLWHPQVSLSFPAWCDVPPTLSDLGVPAGPKPAGIDSDRFGIQRPNMGRCFFWWSLIRYEPIQCDNLW